MRTNFLYAALFTLMTTACGGAGQQERQPSSEPQTDSISSVPAPDGTEKIEGIARQIYMFAVLAQEPDIDFLKANCTEDFAGRLSSAYDYDGEGYALWLLRSGEQDGDGPTDIIDVSAVSDCAVMVEYVDMGRHGAVTLHFDKTGKIDGATRPDGSSVFASGTE